eukprot:CFRG1389T1
MKRINSILVGEVLLTGATGFVGIVTLSKLLRNAPHIKRVHLLIRPSANQDANTRFKCLCDANSLLFRGVDMGRVSVISGDMTACDSISDENIRLLLQVDTVIHCAASTDWRAPLTELLVINVSGAISLFNFCVKNMPNLRSYVHTSTAYSCTVKHGIGYNPENVDGSRKTLLGPSDFPNGYTYSKYLAEAILAEKVADMQIPKLKVVRPAIVTNVLGFDNVPAGWGMDMRGVNAAFLCYKALRGKPLTQVVPYNRDFDMHCIPVDTVANILIAAAAQGYVLASSANECAHVYDNYNPNIAFHNVNDAVMQRTYVNVGVSEPERCFRSTPSSTGESSIGTTGEPFLLDEYDICAPSHTEIPKDSENNATSVKAMSLPSTCHRRSVNNNGQSNNAVIVYNAAPGANLLSAEAFFKAFVPQKLVYTKSKEIFDRQLTLRTGIIGTIVGQRKGFKKMKRALMLFSCFGHSMFFFPIGNVQSLDGVLDPADREKFPLLCDKIDYQIYTKKCCEYVEKMVDNRKKLQKAGGK